MRSNTRGRGALIRGALVVTLLALGLNACASVAGGAAVLAAVGIAALTTRCYDYVDVTVLDADGRKTCNATVTAKKGNSQFELPSCYFASLTDGSWTLSASLPGSAEARTTVVVDHAHDCTRYVQSVELTLNRPGSSTQTRRPLSAPAASSSAATEAIPNNPPPAAPPPETPSTTPPDTPGSPQPPSSAAPPVGVFPDTQTSH